MLAAMRQCPWLRRDGFPHRICWLSSSSAHGYGAMGSRTEYVGCHEAAPMAAARWAPAQNMLAVMRQCPWLWRDGLPHRIFWLSRGSACGSGAMGSRAEYFGCLEAVPVATARWAPARNIVVLNDHNATTAQPYNQTTTQPHKHTPTQPHNHTTTQPRDQQTT